MTFAQYLAQRSGLTSGTLMAHLSAIQSGTGTGETIFAPRFTVSVTTLSHVVTQRQKADSTVNKTEVRRVTKRAVDPAGALMLITPNEFIFTSNDSINVQRVIDELWVLTTVEESST